MPSGIETKQEKYFRESRLLHEPTIQVQYNSIRSGNNSTIYNILFACLVRDFECHITAPTCLNTCHHHIGLDSFAFVAHKLKRMSFNCNCFVQTVTIRSECWTQRSGGGEIRAVNV